MKLATILLNGTQTVVGKVGNEPLRRIDISHDMVEVIREGRMEAEASYLGGRVVEEPEAALKFLPPIPQPRKLLAIGLNYMDHCREQNVQPPSKPLMFAKMTSSLLAPSGIIEWDPTVATRVDYEAELAVVYGKETRLVSEENALSHVFGYTCANDVTARDLQKGDGQWTRGKGMDTFCPLGPWIVTADEIPDPQKLAIRSELNGVIRQNSSTSEMVFGVSQLVSYVSQSFTMQPGDVLLTGTPAGVGEYLTPPGLMHDGDKIVVEIENIGRLENLCRELTFRVR